jgi:hypothetical protein
MDNIRGFFHTKWMNEIGILAAGFQVNPSAVIQGHGKEMFS